jgi:hypothetical protein
VRKITNLAKCESKKPLPIVKSNPEEKFSGFLLLVGGKKRGEGKLHRT